MCQLISTHSSCYAAVHCLLGGAMPKLQDQETSSPLAQEEPAGASALRGTLRQPLGPSQVTFQKRLPDDGIMPGKGRVC